MSDDVLAEFESLIDAAEEADAGARGQDPTSSPWRRDADEVLDYEPNTDLLEALLSGPKSEDASTQSGRLAKAFDAWMSYELRRAQFHPSEVWPRNRSPRVSSKEIDALQEKVDKLVEWVDIRNQKADLKAQRLENRGDPQAVAAAAKRLQRAHTKAERAHERRQLAHQKKTAEAIAEGKEAPPPPEPLVLPQRAQAQDDLLPGLRAAIQGVTKAMPNINATNVLGRFYIKQVDVVVGSWDRGPDVLISGKTMFSSFAKNTKNRYEETLGEASNLRDRYPLAAMGYAFLVSDDIFKEAGAYARLQDLLMRTRKPYGPYDATMLLIATWNPTDNRLRLSDPLTYPDPAVSQQKPPVDLSASRFFTDLLNTTIMNTPVGIHEQVRELRNGAPVPGGAPDLAADADADADQAADGEIEQDAESDVDLDAEVDPAPEDVATEDGDTHPGADRTDD